MPSLAMINQRRKVLVPHLTKVLRSRPFSLSHTSTLFQPCLSPLRSALIKKAEHLR